MANPEKVKQFGRTESGKRTMQTGNLSKLFLLRLQEGQFLVSNTSVTLTQRRFAEDVSPPGPAREEQWLRVKAARADQLLCHVFQNRSRFDAWERSWQRECVSCRATSQA
jgi:hypothetical protein